MPATAATVAGTVTGTGWTPDSGTLQTACATSDNVRAVHAATVSDFLKLTNFGFAIPAGSTITKIEVSLEGRSNSLYTPGVVGCTFGMWLTKDGSATFGSENEQLCAQFSDSTATYTFNSPGVTAAEVNASTFGVLLRKGTNSDESPAGDRQVDRLTMTVTYTLAISGNPFIPEIDQMDIRHLADKGGLKSLGGEALPSLSSADEICTTIPAGTRVAIITVRTADITVRFDGSTPTAGANGIDIKAGSNPLILPMTKDQLALIKGIQSGGTATGWIEYLGKP